MAAVLAPFSADFLAQLDEIGTPPGLKLPAGFSPPPGLEAPPGLELPAWMPAKVPVHEMVSDAAPLVEVKPAAVSAPAPEGDYQVLLRNLPNQMTSSAMMWAMLEQAKLDSGVTSLRSHPDGRALMTFSEYACAQRCVKHFHGRRWGKQIAAVEAIIGRSKGETSTDVAPQPTQPVVVKTLCADAVSFVPSFSADAPAFVPAFSAEAPAFVPAFSANAPAFVPASEFLTSSSLSKKKKSAEYQSSCSDDASTDAGTVSETEGDLERTVSEATENA